ncbi:hypothetical protein CspeluHIS016_0406810 [Cutaneotrichosporon spelunceum]|uniref:Ketoreductase domain-containing protein n=1 Tax=Cutaneotrichosporon spelunceum TaxID=1672016 RepID=A0AAD3YDD6_9TREE|nr:hypothetical protein CspeluHIS016_0406810 [Cutaneotrichosporon spelunceum]
MIPTRLLEDKVVVVTGSSSGIGAAVALACAQHGASAVILHHLDSTTEPAARAVQSQVEAAGAATSLVSGDIADQSTASALVAAGIAYGRIDVLVSNAGICPFHAFLDLPAPLWARVQDVNLTGAFYAVQAVANVMANQVPRGGSIVAVSSISALMGGGEQCHYTPTKAGLRSLMESCAIALGGLGIRWTIETDLNREDLGVEGKRERMIARVPLGRLGVPDDVAQPVVFFASDMARYCTGASLLVDGGVAISLQ